MVHQSVRKLFPRIFALYNYKYQLSAQFLLNCERSSKPDLLGWLDFKRNQAKYREDELSLCK